MPCSECARLLTEFVRQADGLYDAVETLATRIEFAGVAEYFVLKIAMDEARIDSELARLELMQHKMKHAWVN
jgi:hypothetical protein